MLNFGREGNIVSSRTKIFHLLLEQKCNAKHALIRVLHESKRYGVDLSKSVGASYRCC
jgi:hypothetical protein